MQLLISKWKSSHHPQWFIMYILTSVVDYGFSWFCWQTVNALTIQWTVWWMLKR